MAQLAAKLLCNSPQRSDKTARPRGSPDCWLALLHFRLRIQRGTKSWLHSWLRFLHSRLHSGLQDNVRLCHRKKQ
jgi:hypothetical protein